jgi:DNA mismatch endonuclease (patch repair protein)
MDVFNKETRSGVMQKVRSKENKSTELKLIQLFRENGITGWRRGYPARGKPDFVFLKEKVAVFADGCFWHGHDCRNTRPADNADYWQKKRERNMRHDKETTALFEKRGWKVLRIWECELKKAELPRTAQRIWEALEFRVERREMEDW